MGEHSTILHVDMDAFFASVSELDYPQYKGKPLVVGAGARGVVLSANYAARKFGIKAAMPVSRAQRMAPNAIFIPPDHERYSQVSRKVMEIFFEFTPHVEPLSLDEAFLDVTGSRKLFGSGRNIAELIRKRVFASEKITCTVGIATTKFIAKLASGRCKPNGILEIFRNRENLEIFNKKALYIYIREIIDVKTPKITKISNQLYDIFKINYVFYLENGYAKF